MDSARRPMTSFLSATLLVLGMGWATSCEAASPSVRVLIVTGEDTHHDWRKTTPVLRKLLEEDTRLEVDVLSDLSSLRSTDLNSYKSVVIHFKNKTAKVPGRVAFDNLRQHVREGGGLVLVHFACGAFQEFKPEYLEMAGRVWMGFNPPAGRRQHDPRGPFEVVIANDKHPITAGMGGFSTDDELYTCLEGDNKITVLAAAKSRIDGKLYPMALVHEFHEGRVFLCTLGHDVRALEADGVGELYRRGCAWSAGEPAQAEAKAKAEHADATSGGKAS